MKSTIELHDSECLAIETDSRGDGAVILDAYVHRREPGVSPWEGGMQRVRFAIESINTSGEIRSLPATIYRDFLEIRGARIDELPLPSVHSGEVSLTLVLLEDAQTLCITGKNLSITSEGGFRFIEHVDRH